MGHSAENEWLWNARCTQWVFKKISDNVDGLAVACMDPEISGFIDDRQMGLKVRELKKAGVNLVLTEGLRRLMLYEHQGKTALVAGGIKKAAEACHKENLKIIHHTTATFAGPSLEGCSDEQLEWLSVDARTGRHAFLKEWGGWYLWCLNNPGFRNEYFRLAKYVMAETGVDGFMTDEVYFRTGWYNCSCRHCREKFKAESGFVLPDAGESSFWGNFANPAFRAWLRFRLESVGDFYEDLSAALREAHPHPVLLGCKNAEPEPAHSQYYGENNDERMRGTNCLFVESGFSTNLYSWRWLASCFAAYSGLSSFYNVPVIATTYHNHNEGFFSWALRRAHGMRVWATASVKPVLSPKNQLLNFKDDLAMYSELFSWEKKHEPELTCPARPLANVALLLSSSTRDMADHGGGWDYYVREMVGWGQALTDAFIQYAVMAEQGLTCSGLQQYDLVILPNAACLSDAAVLAAAEYVSKGGSLIFTNETGRYDENGSEKNSENRLAKELGISGGLSSAQRSVHFGGHGLGKWAYFSHRPGISAYTTANKSGDPRIRDAGDVPVIPDEERRLQISLMLDAVSWTTGDSMPLSVKQAPAGLLVRAFSAPDGNTVVIHMLNCRGEKEVGFGMKIPCCAPVAFPPIEEDILMDLDVGSVAGAYLISPDWDGRKDVRPEAAGPGVVRLTIPADSFKRYAALCVSR